MATAPGGQAAPQTAQRVLHFFGCHVGMSFRLKYYRVSSLPVHLTHNFRSLFHDVSEC